MPIIQRSRANIEDFQDTMINYRVAIILAYFNGCSFIEEQVNSIFRQTHQNFHVFLWDDASSHEFCINSLSLDKEQTSKLSVGVRPENIGVSKNFINAMANLGDGFDYFAFCDQDDIWHEDKIEKAVAKLNLISADVPALYCGRTEIVDSTCEKSLGPSSLFCKPPSFENALVQNIAGGNTMLFNKVAKELIVKASVNVDVVSHDWWSYLLVTGFGGRVIYDQEPCLKYRQHSNNVIGENKSRTASFLRFRKVLQGKFLSWNDINIKALEKNRELLTEGNQDVLNQIIEARKSSLFKRVMLFRRSGIHRQTFMGNIGLLLGILLNKV
jgi:glycosyltransferase involved in cell wall biosynthesis